MNRATGRRPAEQRRSLRRPLTVNRATWRRMPRSVGASRQPHRL